jgi:hypothetical protein
MAGQGGQGNGIRAQGDGVIGCDHALIVQGEAEKLLPAKFEDKIASG